MQNIRNKVNLLILECLALVFESNLAEKNGLK